MREKTGICDLAAQGAVSIDGKVPSTRSAALPRLAEHKFEFRFYTERKPGGPFSLCKTPGFRFRGENQP